MHCNFSYLEQKEADLLFRFSDQTWIQGHWGEVTSGNVMGLFWGINGDKHTQLLTVRHTHFPTSAHTYAYTDPSQIAVGSDCHHWCPQSWANCLVANSINSKGCGSCLCCLTTVSFTILHMSSSAKWRWQYQGHAIDPEWKFLAQCAITAPCPLLPVALPIALTAVNFLRHSFWIRKLKQIAVSLTPLVVRCQSCYFSKGPSSENHASLPSSAAPLEGP